MIVNVRSFFLAEKLLYRKWKSIRDNFFKAEKAGKKYKYSGEMKYLANKAAGEEEARPMKLRKVEHGPPQERGDVFFAILTPSAQEGMLKTPPSHRTDLTVHLQFHFTGPRE